MEKIKVLFTGTQLRQRRRETILNPPEGVEYRTMVPIQRMRPDHIISKATPPSGNRLKGILIKIINSLKLPNFRYIQKKYLSGISLIHTPGQLLLNRFPYVVEVDNPACLARYDLDIFGKRKGILARFLKSRYCRKIICISQAAKESMAAYFPPEITAKCTVVYPYVKINPYRKTENLDKVILLSCNTKFYMKGTREVLLAYEELRKEHQNLELWIVSNTPKEFLEKYKDLKDIKFFEAKYSKQELYERFYSQCDIFVQPSYQDSFGLVYLELAASGKPIVTTDLYAIPEIVVEGYNGFLIKSPLYMYNPDHTLKPEYFPMKYHDTEEEFYKKIDGETVVRQLTEKLGRLIVDPGLRQRMGQNSLLLVGQRFSEERRKEKLKEIYGHAYEKN